MSTLNNCPAFSGEYRFLSNFYVAEVWYEDLKYPSSEHAYQAAKTKNRNSRCWVLQASTPGEAKRRGEKIPLREDWEQVKVGVMYSIVLDKFTRHPELAKKLLATGDEPLLERNTWNDTFWGVDEKGEGKNYLGKILMKVRAKLRAIQEINQKVSDANST